MTFKSGFVAIIGRPNVGKSTFLNHVMGQKIAIMSDKAQTTRNKIMGIYTTDKEQIVFIDTPGIHKPKTALGDFRWNLLIQPFVKWIPSSLWYQRMNPVVRVII